MNARLALTVSGCLLVAWAASAQESTIVDDSSVPLETIGNYYRHAHEAPVEQMAHTPPENGLPLPESWVSSMFDPQPRWDFRAEALWLQPNFDNSNPLATQAQSTGTAFTLVPIGVRGDGDLTTAIRGSLEYHFNEQGSFETAGFWMDGPTQTGYRLSQQDQTYYFDGLAPIASERGFMLNAPTDFPLVSTVASMNWAFRSYGAETNLLHHFICMSGPISDLALGIGGRYLRVEEDAALNVANELDGTVGYMAVQSKNNVYGPQFLGRARLNGPGKRIRWLFEGRIGLMANSNSNENSIASGSTPLESEGVVKTTFAPLFEGLFACEVYLCWNIVAYGGYQLLYLDRINRAGGQFTGDINQFISAPENLGDLFLYGPRVGLLWSF